MMSIEFAFIQLDTEIREELERRYNVEGKSQRETYNEAVSNHLAGVMALLSEAGFGLSKAERKRRDAGERRPQRRKIDADTWTLLGKAADLVDLSRQDLLRAVLRRHLKLDVAVGRI